MLQNKMPSWSWNVSARHWKKHDLYLTAAIWSSRQVLAWPASKDRTCLCLESSSHGPTLHSIPQNGEAGTGSKSPIRKRIDTCRPGQRKRADPPFVACNSEQTEDLVRSTHLWFYYAA